MSSPIAPEVIRRLVEVGTAADFSTRISEPDERWLRINARLSRVHWREWVAMAEQLGVQDHIALVRGLVAAIKWANWERGSPSPLIWVYGALDRRLPWRTSFELATWVVAQVQGYHLPFGGMRLNEAFSSLDVDALQPWEGSFLALLDSLSAARKSVRDKQRQIEEETLAKASAARGARRSEERTAHFARKMTLDAGRSQFLADSSSLDEVARLRMVAERTDLPLPYFPVEWAQVPDDSLARLDLDAKERLAQRLATTRLRAWRRLRSRLGSGQQS